MARTWLASDICMHHSTYALHTCMCTANQDGRFQTVQRQLQNFRNASISRNRSDCCIRILINFAGVYALRGHEYEAFNITPTLAQFPFRCTSLLHGCSMLSCDEISAAPCFASNWFISWLQPPCQLQPWTWVCGPSQERWATSGVIDSRLALQSCN